MSWYKGTVSSDKPGATNQTTCHEVNSTKVTTFLILLYINHLASRWRPLTKQN